MSRSASPKADMCDSIQGLQKPGTQNQRNRGGAGGLLRRSDEFYKEQTSKERMALLQALRGMKSSNPAIKTNLSPNLIFALIERKGRKDEETERNKVAAKELTDGGNGTHLLSAGAIPGMTAARYTSFPKSQFEWSRVENAYADAKMELDALDAEINSIEGDILQKTGRSYQESRFGTSAPQDASSIPIVPVAMPLHTTFKWGGICAKRSSAQTDYAWPNPDEISRSFTKSTQMYGVMTKSCDTVEGNLFINPNAKKKSPKKR